MVAQEQSYDIIGDDMSVDDQADLDLRAVFQHDQREEKKCKEAEQVKEEVPDRAETDVEADRTLKRQKEMEEKVADNLPQPDEELNGKGGDSVLGRAIANSRDETDEMLESNEEYEHKRHQLAEAQKEKEISECAGTDDQGEVDFALKKAIGGGPLESSEFEPSEDKNSLKRLQEEADHDTRTAEHISHPDTYIAPKSSMRNLVEESIGDSVATELSEETTEAPTFDELLQIENDPAKTVISLDASNKIRFVDKDYNVPGDSAQLDHPQQFHLFATSKHGTVKEFGIQADRLSTAFAKYNSVKSLRNADEGQILLTANGKIVDFMGSINQPKIKSLIGYAAERKVLNCSGAPDFKDPGLVHKRKHKNELLQVDNEELTESET